MRRQFRKRLSLDIPTYFHDELKTIAKRKNITMTKIVLNLIYNIILEENKYASKKQNQKGYYTKNSF